MVEALQAWLSDGKHLAFLAGLIVLLYLARDAAHRLLRAVFLLVARTLRLVERWIGFGAVAAKARYERLTSGMKEAELQPRLPDEMRDVHRLVERQGPHDPKAQAALERLEAHVAEHRQVIQSYGVQLQAIQSSPAPARDVKLGHSTGIGLAFAIVLILAVGIAGWLNFALLERPMAEVVGDSYRIMGVPIYRLAALAIIVLEVAVGIVLLEALGVTTMFPQFERLEQKKGQRLAIIIVMTTALVVLALIEAALALTRDEISRLERELLGTLAGTAPSEAGEAAGAMARYAQAAFGLIIPFALAFLGFAIEALIRNGRVVLQLLLGFILESLSFAVRLLRFLVEGLLAVALAAYDLVIFLPLIVERLVRALLASRAVRSS
ncbi:hypothetical protein [Reyranella sp.]|jgi:hypothetical protein|uniref:hypothetical protein n=1 Tax=Reyranella sp. TaxID=1929291 RepID=UPI000BC8C5EF|nr:hypothetical protein [Reyranella sp.]OYY40061.1 MAG: hypothetical protein B7Y57_18255 [Rhodospirillales bacterium 35-66-84]OYZ92470.1 MAG: hypothetical protein B7Y08_20850 [Rhodospirillales bacterium 24-66-33]OZB23778.1 MAG: hypothetical protein B7X63_17715 [Rhodospirillales bacterium 39-66-50]HQS17051.1 hypothetical protein [Reyranella sp.]HQT14978.1 hypothetical protein [Reyranella sp.]